MRNVVKSILVAAAALAATTLDASAQPRTKMTIATGVDPAFSQFYVAKEAGLFEKNGLDVTINTGPSGSAMVPFLINNQVQAAYGSDLAGVINHNVDNNVVAVADGTYLVKWLSVVGRNVQSLDELKGKRIGIAKGTGSEIFWNHVLAKRNLQAADFKIVDIEAPEMLAATERGDIEGFAVWDAEGIYNNINFVYMNRGWIEQNRETAERFMLSLVQANDLIGQDRAAAAKMVAKFLKMPLELAVELMPKVEFDMTWTDRAVATIKIAEEQLASQKKLKAPLDYTKYVYTDLLKKVRPENVKITQLPK
jgi:ABC-type nitrate/sulfonate/bicarbonate transport system substrate-binding protein